MIITGKKFSKPEMSRVINGDIQLPEEEAPIEKVRLDVLMTEKYKSYNRSTLQKFIKAGYVTVNREVVLKPRMLCPRDVHLGLHVPDEQINSDIEPEVIFENDDVVVMNKPEGLLSLTKGDYCPEKTLVAYGLPAHRLDRDTSGVIIIAKTRKVLGYLQRQFAERKTHKIYYAVVMGRPKLDAARIDLPLERDLRKKVTFRVGPNGKTAETFYKVLWSDGEKSLVELRPTTGRTHQLRIHMAYLGCPIVGDEKYGPGGVGYKGDPEDKADDEQRMYLHAEQLEITIPGAMQADGKRGNGERRIFEAPVPKDFLKITGLKRAEFDKLVRENDAWFRENLKQSAYAKNGADEAGDDFDEDAELSSDVDLAGEED